MGNKKRKPSRKTKQARGRKEPSYWMIIAIIAIAASVGLAFKVTFSPSNNAQQSKQDYQRASSTDASLQTQVQLVAVNFKCACGGCGELPLLECDCDMPQGALEEKAFIRKRLKEGRTVDQVVQLLDKKYGHKVS